MKFIKILLPVLLLSSLAWGAAKLQNSDFLSEAQIVGAGGTPSQLLNDTKIWSTVLNQTLDDAISSGAIGGNPFPVYDWKFIVTSGNDLTTQFNVNLTNSATATTTTFDFYQTANRNISIPDASTTLMGDDTIDNVSNKYMDVALNNINNAVTSSFAGFDANGTLGDIANWLWEPDGGSSAYVTRTYAPDSGGPTTNKVYSFETEFTNTQNNTDISVYGFSFDAHQDRTGNNFNFAGNVNAFNLNDSLEGTGTYGAHTAINVTQGFGVNGAGSSTETNGQNLVTDIGAGFISGSHDQIHSSVNINGTVTNDLRMINADSSGAGILGQNLYQFNGNNGIAVGANFYGFNSNNTGAITSNYYGTSVSNGGAIAGDYYGNFVNNNANISGNATLVNTGNSQTVSGNFTGESINQTGHVVGSATMSNLNSNGPVDGSLTLLNGGSNQPISGGFQAINVGLNSSVTGNVQGINFSLGGAGVFSSGVTMMTLAGNNSVTTTGQFTGFNIYNSSPVTGDENMGFISTSGDVTGSKTLLTLNGGGQSYNQTGMGINLGNAVITGSATGLNVNVDSVSSPVQKVAIQSNGGAFSASSPINTGTLTPDPVFNLNNLQGVFTINSGFPTTGQYGFGNNLGGVFLFQDNMVVDPVGLGYAFNGFVGAVGGTAGKVVDTFNFFVGGGSDFGAGGLIDKAYGYRMAGLLPGGGLLMNNFTGFYADSYIDLNNAVNKWGFRSDSTTADNAFAKNVLVGVTQAANASVGLELTATDRAFLPSRLTTVQRDAMTAVTGMYIYNTTVGGPQYYDGGSWQTFNAGGGGSVTNVTASAPLSSTGGATPNIAITQSSATTDGYLSATDWNTFNNKLDSGTFISNLFGDVTADGPGNVTSTVNYVGGSSAAEIHAAELAVNSATSLNVANKLVTRDASGSFYAQDITANYHGTLNTNLTSGYVYVGDASNIAQQVAISGDATLSNAGLLTLVTSGVVAGVYTNATVTVNAKGIITAIASGTGSGGGGGGNRTSNTITSDTVLTTAYQDVFLDPASGTGTINVTLFTAVGNAGHQLNLKMISSGIVNITSAGGNIEFQTDARLNTKGQNLTLSSDGSNWYVF